MIERNVVTPIVEPKMVAANCESFHTIESINYDVPFPCDIYEDKAFKIKPFKASFQERVKELKFAEKVFIKQATKPLLRYPLDGGIITQQPVKETKPEGVPEVPEGLEALQRAQHLFIKQSVYRTVETHYQVLDSDGEKIFMADELTDTSTRAFCRGTKPFDISFFIRSGMYRKEVMKMSGEPRSCGCGGDITLKLTKHTLGIIEQGTDCSLPYFYVRDWEGKEILHIVGPPSRNCFSFSLDKGGEFDILVPESNQIIGKIAKYWGGKEKEQIGSKIGDIWGVKFPLDMRACFLLNFQYQDVLDED